MLTRRPATLDDYDFLYALRRAALKESVARTWGWDETWQQNYFREKFDPAKREVLQWQGEDVGTLAVREESDELYVALISIVPEFQGYGRGTAVLQNLIYQAQQTGKFF